MWLLWNWPLLNVVGEHGSGWPRNFINSGPFITLKSTSLILLYRWWLLAYCLFAISIVACLLGDQSKLPSRLTEEVLVFIKPRTMDCHAHTQSHSILLRSTTPRPDSALYTHAISACASGSSLGPRQKAIGNDPHAWVQVGKTRFSC